MFAHKKQLLLFFAVASFASASAQNASVQVTRENRTITVTAKHTMTVEAEVAILHIGYRNSGPDKDAVYTENLRMAAAIQNAFGELKVPDTNIATEKLRVDRTEPDEESKRKQI